MFQSTTANNKSQKNSFGSPSTHEEEQKASQPQKIFRTGFDGSAPIDFVSQSGSNAATAQLASNDKEEELQMKAKEEEELPLQGKNIVKEKIQKKSASSSGSTAMPNDVQTKMESSFGTDFSGVNIYANDQSTTQMGALAYTQGNNVHFTPGQYNPGSQKGQELLGHELTHVVQQRQGRVAPTTQGKGLAVNDSPSLEKEADMMGAKAAVGMKNDLIKDVNNLNENARPVQENIQRKIEVNGNAYTPTQKYLDWLKNNHGTSAVEIVNMMHNTGNPPVYKFDSFEAMGYEIRVRNKAVEGMNEAHNGSSSYPTTEPDGYLNPTYWVRNGWMDFSAKSPLPSGKQASDAIEAIFAPGAGTQLECLTMTVAIEYYSLLKGLGANKFNNMFPGGAGLIIKTGYDPSELIYSPKYETITALKSELLPGDWVYFKNFSDYLTKHPGGLWQGENAIVMGNDKFRGFGVSELSEDQLNDELVKAYNSGLPPTAQKTKAQLLAQGGGLLSSPVLRPVIKEILK